MRRMISLVRSSTTCKSYIQSKADARKSLMSGIFSALKSLTLNLGVTSSFRPKTLRKASRVASESSTYLSVNFL